MTESPVLWTAATFVEAVGVGKQEWIGVLAELFD